jgi:septum formation protein
MPPRELVLASTSRYRQSLLCRLGLPFCAAAPDCDERALAPANSSAEVVATTLARAKAQSLASLHPSAHILGCDQVIDLDGEILGKPGTVEGAVAQLSRLRGRTHRIVTAVALLCPDGSCSSHVDMHSMRMRALTDEALRRYVDAERPLDCAGSYKIESGGLLLFEAVAGDDYTAVIGLPLLAVVALLEKAGFPVPP